MWQSIKLIVFLYKQELIFERTNLQKLSSREHFKILSIKSFITIENCRDPDF